MDDRAVFGGKEAPQIVIVDNDAVGRRALLMLLKSHGFEVKAYALGRSLIDDPKALRARLLIVDSVLPDMDGLTLRHALRDAGWNGATLMLTAGGDDQAERTSDGSFDKFVEKPYLDHILINCVSGLLASARYSQFPRDSAIIPQQPREGMKR